MEALKTFDINLQYKMFLLNAALRIANPDLDIIYNTKCSY